MTIQAARALENAKNRYAELSVGDKVIAPLRDGSQMVTCRIYAIGDNTVSFLWNAVVFSVDLELAAQTMLLIERFNRAAVIAEILSMVA